MKNFNYSITDIYNNEGKDWAKYTVTSRAIPHIIDGFKPSARFYIYSSILNSKTKFAKVASIAGICSKFGYNHGEMSLMGVGQLMGADWRYNIQLIEGEGSFGTRLVQDAGAPRYIFTKLHSNFDKYISDIDISEEHIDPEHLPPKFYVPVIPLVLANGADGIGTGYATKILPRDPKSLIKACQEYIKTGEISKRIPVKFPHFKGKTKLGKDGKFYSYGCFERKSATKILITEVPYSFDREGYIKVLDKLEMNDNLVRYDDISDKSGFKFEVTLKREQKDLSEMEIIKLFKLEKIYSENITVVGTDDLIKNYDDERDLIKDFCDWRLEFLNKRISTKIDKFNELYILTNLKSQFVQYVLNDDIIFKGKKKSEIVEQLTNAFGFRLSDDVVDKLLSMQIYSLTVEMIEKLEKELLDLKKQLTYWKKTDNVKQFNEDLGEL